MTPLTDDEIRELKREASVLQQSGVRGQWSNATVVRLIAEAEESRKVVSTLQAMIKKLNEMYQNLHVEAESLRAVVGNISKVWMCDYCNVVYAEYINGCPKCYMGEVGTASSVRLVDAIRIENNWVRVSALAARTRTEVE